MDELPKAELTRRHFVEALHTNPLMRTPAGAWISRSEKLEHGKTQALFACDSVNYLHFDAQCRAVERVWLSRQANLNPAGQGVATEYEKTRRSHEVYLLYKGRARRKRMLDQEPSVETGPSRQKYKQQNYEKRSGLMRKGTH